MISKQITLLNETTIDCLNEIDEIKVVQRFTEVGMKVLGADFGFVWLNSSSSKDLELVYKSPNLPFVPKHPRKKGRNYSAIKSSKPNFVIETQKTPDAHYVSKYIKSFVIIPLVYKHTVYGSMVLCFKEIENFPEEKKILATFIGNSVAQTITIRRLITSEHKTKIISEKQEARFRALIGNSYEIITHIDKKGRVLYISPSVKKILGLSVDDVIGKNISEFIYNNDHNKTINYIKKILENPKINHVMEFRYKNKNGDVIFLESTSTNMSGNRNLGGIVINIRDITERKKFEQTKEAKRLLNEEKIKVESIADATHELRTPLAIIKGNVDLALQNKVKNPKSPTNALHAINHEINHLVGIVSDLSLLTTETEKIKRRIVVERINLKTLISISVKRCKVLSYKKNISVITKNIPSMFIFGEKDYLEKMLNNLIKNSIAYGNKNGKTIIQVEVVKRFVKIIITDNGIGIPKEDLPHIFDRFYKVDKSHKSNGDSTGLGLSIVKWIAEVHGGEVNVKNAKKGGTVFTVILPIKDVNH